MARPSGAEERRETGRVEAFSDGVFAIAVTLLVLTIPVPHPPLDKPLPQVVLGHWADFLAYTVSFLTILVMWLNHHGVFQLISRIDRPFLILNGLLLLLITFVNYPTALVASYIDSPDGAFVAALYSATLVLIAIFYNLLWRYAAAGERLIARAADPHYVKMLTSQYRFGPLLYLVAFALAFAPGWGAWASIALNAALAVYFAFTGRINQVRPRSGNGIED
jgi:uncharacterized membrane protein